MSGYRGSFQVWNGRGRQVVAVGILSQQMGGILEDNRAVDIFTSEYCGLFEMDRHTDVGRKGHPAPTVASGLQAIGLPIAEEA
jgi:hypothetical protein